MEIKVTADLLDGLVLALSGGRYPDYQWKKYEREGIKLDDEPEDYELLKNYTVDFLSFSCYGSGVLTTHETEAKASGNLGMNGVKNPYLETNAFKVVGKDVKGLKWILTEDEVSDEEYADALVIVTDTANTPRIDDERYDKGKYLIKIDHHPNDDAYGDILLVRPEASSCSEIIVDLVNASDGELSLTKEAARRLYAGIIGDTGRFMYDCTTPHTMRVTAQLLEQGIDAALVNRKMDEINEAEAKLSAYVYQNLQITKHHAALAKAVEKAELHRKEGILLHRVFRTLIKGIELTDETEIKGRVDLGTADSYHVYGVVDENGTRIELEKE